MKGWRYCLILAISCTSPKVKVPVPAAECSLGSRPLPVCSSNPAHELSTVADVATARLTHPVVIRGRLVIGGECIEDCSWTLFPALAPEDTDALAPSNGPLLILTSLKASATGFAFRETIHDGRFPGRCAQRRQGYCCGFDVSGQLVLAGGHGIPPPSTSTRGAAAPDCWHGVENMHVLAPLEPGPPGCPLSGGWRESWDDVWGFAVDWACEIPEN